MSATIFYHYPSYGWVSDSLLISKIGGGCSLTAPFIFLIIHHLHMVEAYNYRIKNSDDCYWIYLNEMLFGTIEKGKSGKWYINLQGRGEQYSFRSVGFLNKMIMIRDIDSSEDIACIRFPFFVSVFPRVKYIPKNNRKLKWVSKNIFSICWRWEYKDEVIIETIEDLAERNNSGIITLASYNENANLLIATGVFLSLWRKRQLTFGLYRYYNKDKKEEIANMPIGMDQSAYFIANR